VTWGLILAALPIVTALLMLAAMKGARIRAAAEFAADRSKRELDALKGDIRRSHQLEKEVEVAKQVVLSGDLDLSERLRRSGRARTTK
jgi:hypothetical protein